MTQTNEDKRLLDKYFAYIFNGNGSALDQFTISELKELAQLLGWAKGEDDDRGTTTRTAV